MNKRTAALLSTVMCSTFAAFALAPAPATAQQIVKWTDEQGQVHFSDHAPPGQNTTNVVVPKAPKFTPPANPTASRSYGTGSGPGPGQAAPDSEAERRAMAAKEQQRRWDEQAKAAAAASLKADKELIAQCKANRETYCNQSADAIRKQEHMIAEIQYADAVTHRQELADRGIYTPAPPPPPPLKDASGHSSN